MNREQEKKVARVAKAFAKALIHLEQLDADVSDFFEELMLQLRAENTRMRMSPQQYQEALDAIEALRQHYCEPKE